MKILSAREWNKNPSLQVVYEWEDIIASTCDIELDLVTQSHVNNNFNKPIYIYLQKLIRHSFFKKYIDSAFNFYKRKKQLYVAFYLYPLPVVNHYLHQDNFIIILLDCFEDVINLVPGYFSNTKLLFVTNLEVYNRLTTSSISAKIRYVPLSISDKYYSDKVPEKSIDVLQIGRQNPVLHNWMLEYIKKHPETEYVYASIENNKHSYYSTTKGFLGPVDGRGNFMDFLGSAKVVLLSSPGIDGGEKRTGGFNPVTPRFYESAVKYCYMVGRYPENGEDFNYNKINSVCKNADSYLEFENYVSEMLATPFNQQEKYQKFIKKHLTSATAKIIQAEVEKL